MRSKKFDVIAVDELDTMYLEADFTDAIVSADAASKKCSRAFSGLLLNDGSTADISEVGGCDNDNRSRSRARPVLRLHQKQHTHVRTMYSRGKHAGCGHVHPC